MPGLWIIFRGVEKVMELTWSLLNLYLYMMVPASLIVLYITNIYKGWKMSKGKVPKIREIKDKEVY